MTLHLAFFAVTAVIPLDPTPTQPAAWFDVAAAVEVRVPTEAWRHLPGGRRVDGITPAPFVILTGHDSDTLRRHEVEHLRQWYALGPAFLPLYAVTAGRLLEPTPATLADGRWTNDYTVWQENPRDFDGWRPPDDWPLSFPLFRVTVN